MGIDALDPVPAPAAGPPPVARTAPVRRPSRDGRRPGREDGRSPAPDVPPPGDAPDDPDTRPHVDITV